MAFFRRVSHGQAEIRRELATCIEQASALQDERSARILNRNGCAGRGMGIGFSKRSEERRSAPRHQNIKWRQSSSSGAREYRQQNSRRKIGHVPSLWRKAQQVRYNGPESAAPYHGWRASQRAVPRHMLQLEWRKPLSVTMVTASSSARRRVFAFSSRRDMNTRSSACVKQLFSEAACPGIPFTEVCQFSATHVQGMEVFASLRAAASRRGPSRGQLSILGGQARNPGRDPSSGPLRSARK